MSFHRPLPWTSNPADGIILDANDDQVALVMVTPDRAALTVAMARSLNMLDELQLTLDWLSDVRASMDEDLVMLYGVDAAMDSISSTIARATSYD